MNLLNPSNPWEWILTIVLFVVSLGLLITLHELGHLSVAKMFKVYCYEFSVGFGPALVHVKRKKGETYFSLRAIPLGGYVSMYGEDSPLPDGLDVPKSRSLDGINRWKRAGIMVAGITMNLIVAFALFFVSNVCLPVQRATSKMTVTEESTAFVSGFSTNDKMAFMGPDSDSWRVYVEYETNKGTAAGYFYIVDDDVVVGEKHYVCTYAPLRATGETNFAEAIRLYDVVEYDTAVQYCETFKEWKEKGYELERYPNFKEGKVSPTYDMHFFVDVLLRKYDIAKDKYADPIATPLSIETYASGNDYFYKDTGLSLQAEVYWPPIGDRFAGIFIDFANASVAVFRGIIALFSGGFMNLTGIVGMFSMSASVFASYGFATYLYFWGLISVNLAIFNLLPFPGLDGWQLVVTAVEGSVNLFKRAKYKKTYKNNPEGVVIPEYQEWKIPTKVKAIMSYIGLGLLLLLGIAIIVWDILRLFVL